MAAARSRDPVLAKIRLMWVLTVWLLRNSCAAISGLVSPRAMRARISVSRWVRPSGPGVAQAAPGGAGAAVAASTVAWVAGSRTVSPSAAAGSAGAIRGRLVALVR